MVRLKEGLFFHVKIKDYSFQFHYGTIKRINSKILFCKPHEFQFHYGTIKSLFSNCPSEGSFIFQFHYGTIKSFPTLYINFES